MPISEALATDFQTETAHTRKILAAVPEDKLEWKPHEKSMSLGQLAGHVAECPSWIRSMMEDELDFASAGKDYRPFVAESGAALLEAFEKNASAFTDAIDGRDDAFFAQTWTMRHGDKVLMSVPRQDAIRSTAIHHLIHHRGQLSVYLRLLDVPVPGTYGPTADDPAGF